MTLSAGVYWWAALVTAGAGWVWHLPWQWWTGTTLLYACLALTERWR